MYLRPEYRLTIALAHSRRRVGAEMLFGSGLWADGIWRPYWPLRAVDLDWINPKIRGDVELLWRHGWI